MSTEKAKLNGEKHVEEGRVRRSEVRDVLHRGLLDLQPHVRAWVVRMSGHFVRVPAALRVDNEPRFYFVEAFKGGENGTFPGSGHVTWGARSMRGTSDIIASSTSLCNGASFSSPAIVDSPLFSCFQRITSCLQFELKVWEGFVWTLVIYK